MPRHAENLIDVVLSHATIAFAELVVGPGARFDLVADEVMGKLQLLGNVEYTEHDLATRRVVKFLARMHVDREVLSVRDERGVAPIVVTLPTDRVGSVEQSVREIGIAANVVLAYPDLFLVSGGASPMTRVQSNWMFTKTPTWICSG